MQTIPSKSKSTDFHMPAALAIALLAIWRMPLALGLNAGSTALASHAVSLIIAAGVFMLVRRALTCRDLRLIRCCAAVGLMLSLFVLLGETVKQTGKLPVFSVLSVLIGLFDLLIYTAVATSFLILVYQGAQMLSRREPNVKESLFIRLLGNGFVVFVLLLICWLPVWLAFYPGTFGADCATQFNEFMDENFSPHHPLLHTLMLGSCAQLAIDMHPDGNPTAGIAMYSVLQMVLLAGMLAYACHWLKRRQAPVWARVCVTVFFMAFPFYSLWSFCAHKDVLFSGLVLLFILHLIDLWREKDFKLQKSPFKCIGFVVVAVLMMLMRNNGLYALLLLLPLALILSKGARVRVALLLVGCMGLSLLINGLLAYQLDASESDANIEMLSIPLQQLARTVSQNPSALPEDAQEYIELLYPDGFAAYYTPQSADPVKWAMDSYELDLPKLLGIWLRVGVGNMQPYLEAFLIQNLPYYLPGAEMVYRFDLGITQPSEYYEIEAHSYAPSLKKLYESYDQTLTLFGLPGVRLLSDTAFFLWLCIAALGLAIYRKQKHWIVGLGFLLAIWITCLLGPVAIIRYMLGFFYAMPVILAAMLAPQGTGSLATTNK